MSAFDIFQTVEATMKKITVDGFGDETASTTFTVDIDPVLGRRRIFTNDQEEIEGFETVISPNSNIDLTHERWDLTYNGRTYQIEGLEPFYVIGTDEIDHYEATLR